MKDLINRAVRTSQTGGDGNLNFHMPRIHRIHVHDGGLREHTGCGRQRGEILGASATEAKEMDDDEATNLEAIF